MSRVEITEEQLTEWLLGDSNSLTEQQESLLLAELRDIKYVSRTHGHHKTYDAGCRGILCSAAARHRGVMRYRKTRQEQGELVTERVQLPAVLAQVKVTALRV